MGIAWSAQLDAMALLDLGTDREQRPGRTAVAGAEQKL
jgi:hypothetical protein